MNVIVARLVDSYSKLILAKRKTFEDVPEVYTLSGISYNLRELVELEVAERTINALV